MLIWTFLIVLGVKQAKVIVSLTGYPILKHHQIILTNIPAIIRLLIKKIFMGL